MDRPLAKINLKDGYALVELIRIVDNRIPRFFVPVKVSFHGYFSLIRINGENTPVEEVAILRESPIIEADMTTPDGFNRTPMEFLFQSVAKAYQQHKDKFS